MKSLITEITSNLRRTENLAQRMQENINMMSVNKRQALAEINDVLAKVGDERGSERMTNRELQLVMALKRAKALLENG